MVHFGQLVLLDQTAFCNKPGVFLVVLLKGNSALSSTFLETASVIDFFASGRTIVVVHTSFPLIFGKLVLRHSFVLLIDRWHGIVVQDLYFAPVSFSL